VGGCGGEGGGGGGGVGVGVNGGRGGGSGRRLGSSPCSFGIHFFEAIHECLGLVTFRPKI